MKYHDPANFPQRSTRQVTIYGSVLTISGGSGTIDIYVNGIKNKTILTYSAGLTTDCATWVTNNYAYYYVAGYKVSSSGAVITVVPAWGWDTVNRINVTAPTIDTLSGALTGVFEPDLNKAKIWQVTFGQNITVKRPKNMREGDRLRLELNATGAYTTTFADEKAYRWPGSTEYIQTTTTLGITEGTCNIAMFPREDRITLTGTSGTAAIVAGGLAAKTITWNSTSLTTTCDDFVTANAAAYLAVGLVLTNVSSGTLTFIPSDTSPRAKANFYPVVTIANLTTNLNGTVVSAPAGRMVMDSVVPNIIP
jgi:hypothetical protein